MAIISQETFDKFTEEEKKNIIEDYQEYVRLCKEGVDNFDRTDSFSRKSELERLFDKENLQPESKIKTWDDFLKEFHKGEDWNPKNELADLSLYGMDDKLKAKIIATVKIAKIIEIGYGGLITNKEWKLSTSYIQETVLWSIVCEYKTESKEPQFRIAANWAQPELLSFHTKQQAEEFMSYPENVELVRQYNML